MLVVKFKIGFSPIVLLDLVFQLSFFITKNKQGVSLHGWIHLWISDCGPILLILSQGASRN